VIERWIETFLAGVKNLLRNKLRTFLTMLGMIFGVGSVIAMMAVGAGAEHEIISRIEELGVQNIIVNSVKPPEDTKVEEETQWKNTYGLEFEDAERIADSCSTVQRILRVNKIKKRAWRGSRRIEAAVLGVEPEYVDTFNLKVSRGRPLTSVDSLSNAKVCVIRRGLMRQLETVEDPLGMTLRIGQFPFEIVGVLADDEFRSPTRRALAIDESAQEIYIPYTTSMRTFGTLEYVRRTGSREVSEVELDQIVVQTRSSDDVYDTSRMIRAILEHGHEKRDFEIVVPLELLRQSERTQQVFSIVMVLIASISLLIGGIGIVNIMLATITERTREIGIRRALGARRSDILTQFLTETIAIAIIGGLFGCFFGFAGVIGIERFTSWSAIVDARYVLIALGISCSVGVLFGIFPARRAARMDPIAALRYE